MAQTANCWENSDECVHLIVKINIQNIGFCFLTCSIKVAAGSCSRLMVSSHPEKAGKQIWFYKKNKTLKLYILRILMNTILYISTVKNIC